MSETEQPKDLTAQLAAAVRELWEAKHGNVCGIERSIDGAWVKCDGTSSPNCPHPKPAALVAYEQAQEIEKINNQSRASFEQEHQLPRPGCTCQICHDLRADGAGEQQETAAAIASERTPEQWQAFRDAQPALAYVLTRDETPIRWYAIQARANLDLELLTGVSVHTWRVHAVARVE